MNKLGDHAVVLGASMGGLLAARVLADHYRQVTVVDRDALPEQASDRRGVPQGRHAHALLASGARVLENLFPGFLADLVADGVPTVNDLSQGRLSIGGHQLCREERPLPETVYQASRAHLEYRVRGRVRALPNVTVIEQCEATGLSTERSSRRVDGVRLRHRGNDCAAEHLRADLTVDATGRTGRTPVWLAELGFPTPAEETVPVDVKYVSCRLLMRPCALGPQQLILSGAHATNPRAMALFAEEGDHWKLSLVGYHGHHPPTDREGFLAFAATIAPPEVFAEIMRAVPVGGIVAHRYPASLRRRYELLRRFPQGLLVFGDAICSFNPLYGQGMSVAAKQALALRACLSQGDRNLARRFFRAAAKPVDVAWRLATGGDLDIPGVTDHRPLSARLINRYVDHVLSAAERDPILTHRFLQVTGLVEPPTALLRPSTIARVIAGARRRSEARAVRPQPADLDCAPVSNLSQDA